MVLYQIGRGSKDKNDTLGPSVTISSLPVVRNLMASLFIEVDAPVIKVAIRSFDLNHISLTLSKNNFNDLFRYS